MAGIDQVIPDYRAEMVGGTGPDIGAGAVIRVAITGSGYHTIALSLSLHGRGMGTIETISSPGYLDSDLPILQTTIGPSDWHTGAREIPHDAETFAGKKSKA